MKFGQLIEYNMKNIFIEKSYSKPLSKQIKIEHISASIVQSLKYLLLLYANLRAIEI